MDAVSVNSSSNIASGAEISSADNDPSRVFIYGMNYSPEIAGVGKYTGEIASHLCSLGADVTVLTTPPHYPGWVVKDGYFNRFSVSITDGVKVIRSPLVLKSKMKGIWRLIAPLSFAITSAPIAFWHILRHRPDVVLCIEPTLLGAPIAQLAAKIVGARTVLHVQDLEIDAAFAVGHLGENRLLKRIGYTFESFTLRRFDRIVTISNRMAQKLIAKGINERNISVVRNWVDTNKIYPTGVVSPYRQELGFQEDDFVLLYSGNIGAKQGLSILLDAAEKMQKHEKLYFIVAGEGPAKSELEHRYGHLTNVRFLPFQPTERLNDFMNMPDLHVLTQERGAADLVLPSKLGGMLASGRRILVTADKGTELADFVEKAAVIIPPGEVEEMVAAIEGIRDRRSAHDFDYQADLAQTLGKKEGVREFSANVLGLGRKAH